VKNIGRVVYNEKFGHLTVGVTINDIIDGVSPLVYYVKFLYIKLNLQGTFECGQNSNKIGL
jgi:hypothetical protein